MVVCIYVVCEPRDTFLSYLTYIDIDRYIDGELVNLA